MFDVGFSELILFGIVALVVLGPEKLPHAARIAGAWLGRIRRTVSTMQAEIEREVAAQEIRSKLENELGEIGGSNLVRELEEERRQLESGWQEAKQGPGADAVPEAPSIQASDQPLLAQAAKPLDEVELDGEKAYREWLTAQRQNRIIPPEASTSKDPSAP